MLLERLKCYWELTRLDKPIGVYLLLWPTLIAVFAAKQGHPPLRFVFIYTLGVILMRSAGCIINDIADRNFDRHVERTKDRPLTSGRVSLVEAYTLLILFLGCSLFLVLQTNTETLLYSFVALFLCILYPFTKRFFACPQLMLGLAFAWGIPMAYASVVDVNGEWFNYFNEYSQNITRVLVVEYFWLFAGTVFYALAYDTLYAMVDKVDDLKIKIHSSAILFGKNDKLMVSVFYALMFFCWTMFFMQQNFKYYLFFPIIVPILALRVFYKQIRLSREDSKGCFQSFQKSHRIGLFVLIALELDFLTNAFFSNIR